jgi:hypothetical protein
MSEVIQNDCTIHTCKRCGVLFKTCFPNEYRCLRCEDEETGENVFNKK